MTVHAASLFWAFLGMPIPQPPRTALSPPGGTATETFELITAAAEEFSAALSGSSSAAEAAKKANDRWIAVLKKGGHLK